MELQNENGFTEKECAELEQLVDRRGIASVLFELAAIASLKASHVSESWQDEPLAKRWMRVAMLLEKYPGDAAIGL